ncbi:LytR C-terminal domain-containing protein [Kribbella sp. NBC_01245]|uniref:LytR C-terminal domain-containing protein n=1 Tax=Kribbella sp. NBC_01245 TaxID=2903578 RepID=UPI002E2AB97D|nr:LytR C-terminal domain-containing protein [Kribbella sp. NBC_01245]
MLQPRPHHRIRWQTPITLVVLLGILVGGAWWGWNSLTEVTAEQVCVDQKLPNKKLTAKLVVVNVYNGGAKGGKARETGELLTGRGFNIKKVANEPNDEKFDVAVIRGHSKDSPEVQLVYLQMKQKVEIIEDGRTDHTVDLVLGADFNGLNTGKITSVPVPSGTACLPTPKTPQPIPSGQNPG